MNPENCVADKNYKFNSKDWPYWKQTRQGMPVVTDLHISKATFLFNIVLDLK